MKPVWTDPQDRGHSLHPETSATSDQSKIVSANKSEGRLRFQKRPSYFDGGKPNSVGVIAHADDHLSHPAPVLLATRQDRHLRSQNWGWTSDGCFGGQRPPPTIHRNATIPEDRRAGCPPSVLSRTAWGFSCLANCSASGELLPRLFTLACPSAGS